MDGTSDTTGSMYRPETDRLFLCVAEVSAPEKIEDADDGSGDAIGSVEDVAALASAAQPTGYTFATTNVHTKVDLIPCGPWDDGSACILRMPVLA